MKANLIIINLLTGNESHIMVHEDFEKVRTVYYRCINANLPNVDFKIMVHVENNPLINEVK